MKYHLSILMIVSALLYVLIPQRIYAQGTKDSLNQFVATLQNNPNDSALRTKIILMTQAIKPAPSISDEAREKYVMGITLRDDKEYELAISNINKALLIAPWWGNAYKELGLTLEITKKYDDAIRAYQFYLKTLSDDETIGHVKDEIAIMKAKKMKADKIQEENSPQALEAALLQKVEGAKSTVHWDNHLGEKWDEIYQISNQSLLIKIRIYSIRPGKELFGYNRSGEYLYAQLPYRDGHFVHTGTYETKIFTLQADGKALVELAYSNGQSKESGNTNLLPWD